MSGAHERRTWAMDRGVIDAALDLLAAHDETWKSGGYSVDPPAACTCGPQPTNGQLTRKGCPVHDVLRLQNEPVLAAYDATAGERGDDGLVWECVACDMEWHTYDLEQIQPDGHYACPTCGDDGTMRCVPRRAIDALRAGLVADAVAAGSEGTTREPERVWRCNSFLVQKCSPDGGFRHSNDLGCGWVPTTEGDKT